MVTELYLKYKPTDEEEAQKIMERKRIRFRQIESPRGGPALATLVDRNNKVIAQTSVLNFIEYAD